MIQCSYSALEPVRGLSQPDRAVRFKEAQMKDKKISSIIQRILLSAVLIFLSTSLLIRILLYVFDVIAMLPIIGGLNRLAGAALGLMIALTVVWIFFLIVTLLYATDIGKDMLRMIQENPFLSFLYKNNYIWNVVTGLR